MKNKTVLFKAMVCTAFGAAIFGSFKFAQARIITQSAPKQTLTLPKELGSWKTFESGFDVTSSDVVGRKYFNTGSRWIGVVVRSSPSNQVLHDLTSCLLHADSKAFAESDEHIAAKSKRFDASLANFTFKKGPRRALLWFQKADQTASNRWTWRMLSMTSPVVRDAPVYYQVEVTTEATGDKVSDVSQLKEVAALVFEEMLKH
ncbi:MAG TPA: hypothetical protein V6C89_17805 [Drouetiella sp.]|jgi:hypothetical protein